MPSDFLTDVDIANRALQHVGGRRIASLTETSKNASEVSFCYSKLRRAELRRNIWRFAVRRTPLRALDTDTMLVTPPDYSTALVYAPGSIVTSAGIWYQAREWIGADDGVPDDTTDTSWDRYFGPDTASPYDSATVYQAGELVYTPKSSAYKVYLSLANDNDTDPTAPAAWSETVNYMQDQSVLVSSTEYWSESDLNYGNDPTSGSPWTSTDPRTTDQWGTHSGQKWLDLGTVEAVEPAVGAVGISLRAPNINYPLGVGPSSDQSTRNIYRLPHGWLRDAPQNPDAGSYPSLGAPTNEPRRDWALQGDYFTTQDSGLMIYRFVADISAVSQMDDMFCELLAARIGLEICETITQSRDKIVTISTVYKTFGSEARTVNAIEVGTTYPELDDYLSCRS